MISSYWDDCSVGCHIANVQGKERVVTPSPRKGIIYKISPCRFESFAPSEGQGLKELAHAALGRENFRALEIVRSERSRPCRYRARRPHVSEGAKSRHELSLHAFYSLQWYDRLQGIGPLWIASSAFDLKPDHEKWRMGESRYSM